MIHLVFDRIASQIKVFDSANHSLIFSWGASGDATGNGPMPPGHFILLEPEAFPQDQWDPPTGWGRVRIRDMSDTDVQRLTAAGIAKSAAGGLDVGGTVLPPGACNAYERVIEIHGGGSALGTPGCFAKQQRLCHTLGCTRMHNEDVASLISCMQQLQVSNTFIFSAFGTPAKCNC
jgi:hypothetical protein